MMEKEQLRRADFVTSILCMLFGSWILYEAFQMPMKDTFGGVRNVWYVSPALSPLAIGIALVLLGFVLLIHSIKTGGAKSFIQNFSVGKKLLLSEANQRFYAILLALFSFVYLYIPRIDFFLSIVIFLSYFLSTFHIDDLKITHKSSLFYISGALFFILLFVTGIAQSLNGVFLYSTDVLALLYIIAYLLFMRNITAGDELYRKKLKVSTIITFVVPILICPIFRYLLLVILPHEGGIIELMNLIYYSIR